MPNRKLELFYDIVSPYSYLAFVVLERYCRAHWPLDLVLRPAFLGGVLKSVGNAAPATLPHRVPYLLRDLGRLSPFVGVPLQVPEGFPHNTVGVMRFLTVVARARPEKLAAASRALYDIHWGEGRPVHDAGVFVEGALRAGIDASEANAFAARVGDVEIKELLKRNTDEAVARGAFGFPAMFVDVDGNDEMYFGQDRIELLAHDLRLPWRGPRPE